MDDEEKEMRRHNVAFSASMLGIILCAMASAMSFVSLMTGQALNPGPCAVFFGIGAVGWAWLMASSAKEIDYLNTLRRLRRYYS